MATWGVAATVGEVAAVAVVAMAVAVEMAARHRLRPTGVAPAARDSSSRPGLCPVLRGLLAAVAAATAAALHPRWWGVAAG